MTWLILAFLSAFLQGLYDSFKKKSVIDNAVIPVLFLNTLFCSLIFLPFIVLSYSTTLLDGTIVHVSGGGWHEHKYILLKSIIVLTSWMLGYFGIKRLPLTIVGPINATRPVMILVGAMLFFGERLNGWQWLGVALAVASFFLLSHSGQKEGISFWHNRGILMIIGTAVLGAVIGLYDKFLMAPVEAGGIGLDPIMVQSWYNIYQCGIMIILLPLMWYPARKCATPFRWEWSIVCISVFVSMADFSYFYALSQPDAMISIVSVIRRCGVLVSFLFGALVFHEKNLKSKAIDLLLVLFSMICLYIGSC